MKPTAKPKGEDEERKTSLLKTRSDKISRPNDSGRITRPSDRITRPKTGFSTRPGLPPLSSAELDERVRSVASHTSSVASKQPNPLPLGRTSAQALDVSSRVHSDEPLIAHMTLRGALSTAIDSGLEKDVVLASRRNKIFSGSSFAWGIFGASSRRVNTETRLASSEFPVHEADKTRKPVRTIKLRGVQYKSDARRRKFALPILVVFVIVAIVGTAVGVSLSESSSEGSVCGSADDDLRVRQLIADGFFVQIEPDETLTAVISQTFLTCLPSNAFGELSDSQREELESVDKLSITRDGLKAISRDAFKGPNLSNIVVLDLKENGLSSLPSGLLAPLPNLEEIILSKNAFVELDNDVFSQLPLLKRLFFDSNSLVTFPLALKGAQGMEVLSFRDCGSLLEIEENFFLGSYPNLVSIDLTNTLAFVQYVDEQGFRDFSGLIDDERAVRVTIISSFV